MHDVRSSPLLRVLAKAALLIAVALAPLAAAAALAQPTANAPSAAATAPIAVAGHDEIRGRFRLNGMNRPSLFIDRRNGTITVDGMIKFNGRCDAESGHRRF